MFIKKIFNYLKEIKQNSNCQNLKKQYLKEKIEQQKLIISETIFWDKLKLDIFSKNIKLNNKKLCPYCGAKLSNEKSKSFKCRNCNNKIYRTKEPFNGKIGLFTNKEKELLDNLSNELKIRKKFLNLWEQINNIVLIEIDNKKHYNIQTACQQAIVTLHLGQQDFYTKKGLRTLRKCRFMEGEIQTFLNNIGQATNAYLTLLYIDLMGDYCTLYDEPEYIDKETKKEFPEWSKGFIAPGIYTRAFKEELSIDKYKELFIWNAKILIESLKFSPPIKPEEAWEQIYAYYLNN